jgi:hypothetical protein
MKIEFIERDRIKIGNELIPTSNTHKENFFGDGIVKMYMRFGVYILRLKCRTPNVKYRSTLPNSFP